MMLARLQRLLSCECGTAVTELALAAPMLAVLVMGITDASMAFSRKLELEQGAQRAIEKQMQTTGDDTPEGTIKSEAAAQANVSTDNITVETIKLCNGVKQASYNNECTSARVTSLYLTVTVFDNYRPVFPLFNLGPKQADGSYLIVAKAGIRFQ